MDWTPWNGMPSGEERNAAIDSSPDHAESEVACEACPAREPNPYLRLRFEQPSSGQRSELIPVESSLLNERRHGP
jgi:hypothetical protein